MENYNYSNYHTHVGIMFWIGKGAEKDKDWVSTWWDACIGPVESRLTKDDMRVLAGAFALACVDNNISEIWDMYFFEEEIANVLSRYGIKSYIGEAIMTNPPTGYKKLDAIKETERLVEVFRDNDLVVPVVGYIGPYDWASDEEMTIAAAKFARENKIPVHTHGAGDIGDFNDCKKIYGKEPIEALEYYGFFAEEIPEVVIAHCGVLSDKEINILEKYKHKVKVAVCPRAAAKLNYGKAPIQELIKRGVRVVLGTDGCSPSGVPDIKEEIRFASEVYNVDASYFENANKSNRRLELIAFEERTKIIREWHSCLESLADRAGFDGEKRVEFLKSKELLAA